ncbi:MULTISPECIES: hypothetical protein [Aquimarina]|uniref:hypothetical protein n=1 Tax=Aquimarina TaxID=290174 RepID=UPI000D69C456|nr:MULTISPECIES: hypothetical protein [Aquimarina]
MRIITKLQILCIVLSCAALTSCSEDDGTGILEVDVTNQKLEGDWSLESLRIGNSTKSGILNGENVEFKYTLKNEVATGGGDYTMTFFGNGDLRETGIFSDESETVFVTYNGDRLFESEEKSVTDVLLEYSSIFFNSAALDAKFGVNTDGKSITINSSNGQLSLDVTFLGDDKIRIAYPLTDVTPFFGVSTLTLPEDDITIDPMMPRRITLGEGIGIDDVAGDNVKPVSGTLYAILIR